MKRKILLILLCALFLGIAGYSGSRLYRQWKEYRTGEKAYEELAQYAHLEPSPILSEKAERPATEAPADGPELSEDPDDTNWPVIDFTALLEINPDVVAWIFIEGTNINYPVVQGDDNSHYLDRLFDGSYNSAGTIFLDYRNERGLTDHHSIFYGHHMQNGSMFKQIANYKDQAFYDAHPVCLVMTPNGNYKLEFFAGYVTNMNDQAWKLEFASDEEYALWLEDAISKSGFTSTVKPTAQDRVVTFSTCTYEYNDARFVLVGVLKP